MIKSGVAHWSLGCEWSFCCGYEGRVQRHAWDQGAILLYCAWDCFQYACAGSIVYFPVCDHSLIFIHPIFLGWYGVEQWPPRTWHRHRWSCGQDVFFLDMLSFSPHLVYVVSYDRVLSCLVSFRRVLSYLIWSGLILSCLLLSCLILSCLILSRLVLSHLVLYYLVSSRLILSCLISSYLILSYLVLSCLVSGLPCANPMAASCVLKLMLFITINKDKTRQDKTRQDKTR